MNHSFLFVLFLVLLVAIATTADVLSWNDGVRLRPLKTRKRPQATVVVRKGSVADRKQK